jgi:hypothetical protein
MASERAAAHGFAAGLFGRMDEPHLGRVGKAQDRRYGGHFVLILM